MFKKSKRDSDTEKIVLNRKDEISQSFEPLLESLFQGLKTIMEGVAILESQARPLNKEIWNLAGYITLSNIDLVTLHRELMFSSDEWQRRFLGRQVYVLMYELSKDLPKYLGKSFRISVAELSSGDTFLRRLNKISSQLNIFKNQYSNQLKDVRNFAAAHRDSDVLQQYRIIEAMEWSQVMKLVKEFLDILWPLSTLMKDIITVGVHELDIKSPKE